MFAATHHRLVWGEDFKRKLKARQGGELLRYEGFKREDFKRKLKVKNLGLMRNIFPSVLRGRFQKKIERRLPQHPSHPWRTCWRFQKKIERLMSLTIGGLNTQKTWLEDFKRKLKAWRLRQGTGWIRVFDWGRRFQKKIESQRHSTCFLKASGVEDFKRKLKAMWNQSSYRRHLLGQCEDFKRKLKG